MADMSLPKNITRERSSYFLKHNSNFSLRGILRILLTFFYLWAGTHIIIMLMHVTELTESALPSVEMPLPRIEMGLAVKTLFGLFSFLAGCLLIGAFVLARYLHRRD